MQVQQHVRMQFVYDTSKLCRKKKVRAGAPAKTRMGRALQWLCKVMATECELLDEFHLK